MPAWKRKPFSSILAILFFPAGHFPDKKLPLRHPKRQRKMACRKIVSEIMNIQIGHFVMRRTFSLEQADDIGGKFLVGEGPAALIIGNGLERTAENCVVEHRLEV